MHFGYSIWRFVCDNIDSFFASSYFFSNSYIRKIENHPNCPLCTKDLNSREVDDLSSDLRYKINSLPENIERSETLLKESRVKLERLLGMQSSVERVNKIKADLVPHLKDELKKLEADMAANQEKVNRATADVKEPKDKMNLIAPMVGDMSILEQALRDIEQTRADLEPLRRKLPTTNGANENCDMEGLQAKRKLLTDRIKRLEQEISAKEKKLSDDETVINKVKAKEMEMRTIELSLKGDIQKADGLRAREKELSDEIAKLQETEKAKNDQLNPIKGKIRNAEQKRREAKNDGAKCVNKEKMEYDKLQKDFNNIDNLSKDLDKLAERNLTHEIERCQKLLAEFRDQKTKQVKF